MAPILCNDPFQLDWAIQRVTYLSGATNTGAALRFTLMEGFQGARGGDVPKVVIVVTDGQSQDEVAEAAQLLKDAHVTIFAVGVTNLVNVHQLHQVYSRGIYGEWRDVQIASNPVRVLTVEGWDQLDSVLADSLMWDMCKTEFRRFPSLPEKFHQVRELPK